MPPIPGSFLVFELAIYALAAVCLHHAWRQGPYLALAIVTGAVFCFAAESLVIRVTQEYYYNRFLVMLCLGGSAGPFGVSASCDYHGTCVPLAVPVMESLIVYVAMLTSDRLLLPWPVRSLMDGLLALSVDFGMDPIVSRSVACAGTTVPVNSNVGAGFWVWQLNSHYESIAWIDLNNYAGWFMGIAAFSFTQRLLRRRVPPGSRGLGGDIGVALLSLPLCVLIFAPVVFAYRFLANDVMPEWIPFSVMMAASVATCYAYGRRANTANPLDLVPLAVPLFLYAFPLFLVFAGGYYLERPALLVYWALTFVIGALGFTWPSWGPLFRRSVARPA